MSRYCWRMPLILSVLLWLMTAPLSAQFAIDWSTVDGGGGSASLGEYTVSGTVGQHDAGTLQGDDTTLAGGFWYEEDVLLSITPPTVDAITDTSATVTFSMVNATGMFASAAVLFSTTPNADVTTPGVLITSEVLTATGTYILTVTGLTANTTYFARSILGSYLDTLYSEETCFVTRPAAPAGLQVSAITQTQLTLSWQAVSGTPAVTYVVEYATTTDLTDVLAKPATPNTSLTLTGLHPDTTYYLRVTAVNSTGAGAASAPIAATTTLPVYTVTASAGAGGSVSPAGDSSVVEHGGLFFRATPQIGYEVDGWYLDDVRVQEGGTTYELNDITAPHTVRVTFVAFPAPTVTAITPNTHGRTGRLVVTNLAGTGFRPGATVQLMKAGETSITATDVVVVNGTQITCAFNFTNNASGAWNVVVTNDDGQAGMLLSGVTLTEAPTAPTVLVVAPATGMTNGKATLSATLTAHGKPLSGCMVNFLVNDVPAGCARTNTYGVASLNYAIGLQAAATYPLRAVYAGDPVNAPCDGTATLTVTRGTPVALTVTTATPAITADETAAFTVTASDGSNAWNVSATAVCLISANAGGTWSTGDGVNVYTPRVAGNWTVQAMYAGLTAQTPLAVAHGAAASLTAAPAIFAANSGEAVTYTATARDSKGNTWPVTDGVSWDDGGADGDFVVNSYTPGSAGTVTITATLGTVTSTPCTLTVRPLGGRYTGNVLTLAWNAGTPQLRLGSTPVLASDWYALGDPAGGQIYIAVTPGVNRLAGTITHFDPDGGLHDNAIDVDDTTLAFSWILNSRYPGRLYSLTQTSTIGVTVTTASYYASLDETLMAVNWLNGCWTLTHTFSATQGVLRACQPMAW